MKKYVSNSFKNWTYILVIYTFLLMLLGGYVKAIGAGLSCPDWPLCYGSLFPFFDGNVYPYTPWMIFAEWFHRLIATAGGLFMIAIVYKAHAYRETYPLIYIYSKMGLFLFITQGLFGAFTVLNLLDELIVVAHLGNAILILLVEMILAFYATIYTENFLQSDFIAANREK